MDKGECQGSISIEGKRLGLYREDKSRKCGATAKLTVHHITYARLEYENIETDLITLCDLCHEAEHKRLKSISKTRKVRI